MNNPYQDAPINVKLICVDAEGNSAVCIKKWSVCNNEYWFRVCGSVFSEFYPVDYKIHS